MVARANHNPLFSLGQIVATPAALETIREAGQSPQEFLHRHVAGDWGCVCAEDKLLNDEALIDGSRILSSYRTKLGQRIWVITEAKNSEGHREVTTITLPEEY